MIFQDRRQAGRVLAQLLEPFHDRSDTIVLGLPRGGVPVAYEVARGLHLPLDIFIVRKLGVPGQEELAMGAIASGGTIVINQDVVKGLGIADAAIEEAANRERLEIERREVEYRGGRPPLPNRRAHRPYGRRRACDRSKYASGSPCTAAAGTIHNRRRTGRRKVHMLRTPHRSGSGHLRHHAGPVRRCEHVLPRLRADHRR